MADFTTIRTDFPADNVGKAMLYLDNANRKSRNDATRLRDLAKAIHFLANEIKEIDKTLKRG